MNNIVGTACTAGKNAGKKECVCPKQITIRGPGNFEQWSITAPESVVGWTFAVLEFLAFVIWKSWPALIGAFQKVCRSGNKQHEDPKMMAGEAAKMRKENINIYWLI